MVWDFQTLRRKWSAPTDCFRCKVCWDSCCGSARGAAPCTEQRDAKQPGHLSVRAVCLAERTYSHQESIEVRHSVRMVFYISSGLRHRSPKEGHDLCAGAVVIRAEHGIAGSLGDILFDRPQHSVCVIVACGNVRKGIAAANCRCVLAAPQECDDLCACAGLVRAESSIAGTLASP